jgi:hypothetical protein
MRDLLLTGRFQVRVLARELKGLPASLGDYVPVWAGSPPSETRSSLVVLMVLPFLGTIVYLVTLGTVTLAGSRRSSAG